MKKPQDSFVSKPMGNDQEIEFHEIKISIFQLFAKSIRRSKSP